MRKALCASLLVFLSALSLLFIGCGERDVYTITVSGSLREPGVITYLGCTMNVYQDQASNPCGDCDDQPVSLLVGDNAQTVAAALKQAIEIDYPDGDWMFDGLDGESVSFRPAEGITPEEAKPPTAPAGLDIKGGYGTARSGGGASNSAAQIPENPQRLAAVYGPSYEALTLLGAESRIVVRADVQTENFPWAFEVYKHIEGLPVLEDVHAAVNMETLFSYEPDLVYTFPRPNEIALLEKTKVGYIQGETTRTLDDVKALLHTFAAPLGADARARADAYDEYFDERLAYIKSRTDTLTDAERPTVYYAGTDILTTYGRLSDIIEVIEAAGSTAVTKELEGGNRINTDAEKLASWNPDYIFIDHCGMSGSEDGAADEVAAAAYANAKYAQIGAIKNKRVILTPSGVFYWDMGLQKILLVEYMAKTIHPELFPDLDMAAEVQRFYTEFFDYPLSYDDATRILERRAPDA
jgi:iron complex transport system substrate-binding protein